MEDSFSTVVELVILLAMSKVAAYTPIVHQTQIQQPMLMAVPFMPKKNQVTPYAI
jgi:hypothetical protein